MERLPIDDVLPQLVDHLSTAGSVALKAEPGAGKTTRVPPAILDAGLSVLSNKRPGQIVVLEPRRVAARAAAARMSEERGTELGADIGYRVRHEGRSSKSTKILVCTEGIFLRRLQGDPSIDDVSVVIFDEFHERSIDGDLALALTAQVRRELRPDLRIVVMSATLDTAPIAAFLGDCPAIESAGRTFPVAIDYLKFSSNVSIDRLGSDSVMQMLPKTAGHLLVFLPGVGEIRQTQAILESSVLDKNIALMPLYGDMPLHEQSEVLRPSKQRKVVLATNVAETSLTIEGVDGVIDTGFARVNRFDPNVGLNRLELSRISKASALQRAGRAGRTTAGACLRLWTEREQISLAEFEPPEIERLELSESVLQLLAWGEHDVHVFPWFERPKAESLERALELLDRLDATSGGKLTDLGRAMARFPLQPRLARLLIEGTRFGQAKRAALCAALLAERAPFRNKDSVVAGAHYSDSDVLEQVRAIEAFDANGARDSIVGEIIPGAAKQVLTTSLQLARLVDESDLERARAADKDEAVLRAIMAAFPDRICKRRQPKDRRGVMVGGRGVNLSDQSNVLGCELFLAVDLVDLNRAELSVRRASAVDRNWLPVSHLVTSIEVGYDSAREKVLAFKRTRFCDLILDENVSKIPPDVDPGAVLAEAVSANFDLETLIDDQSREYLTRIICLREWLPELKWPEFGVLDPWRAFLPALCCGCTSIAELRSKSMIAAIESVLNHEQLISLRIDAPEHITLPAGRRVKLQYEPGKPPVLAARIQELFGMSETPRIARARVPVMLHLLAPNFRVQQITADLGSFWKNTYPEVKKELKGRYPKHKWPDDPLKP